MSLLKSEPAGSVRSLEELFAIASAMEREAASRYAEIAARMRQEGSPSLAEVFELLAAEEQGHLDSVLEWSRRAHGQPPDPARIRWRLPEIFDDEGLETSDPRLLSAYRALSVAVRNEERAFAFWSYVAAKGETAEIRRAAELMAHEELNHVSILRRERRKAFHAGHRESDERDGAGNLAALERRLAELLERLAVQAPPQERARLAAFAADARDHARNLEQDPIPVGDLPPPGKIGDDPVVLAELLTDRYLEAGEASQDEDVLTRTQAMAGRAIARLAWLRTDLRQA